MANLLAHPFTLKPDGSFLVRDEATDEYLAERIALIIGTRPGERATVPLFGIDDPTYHHLALSALQVQVELFNIPVTITEVSTRVVSDAETEFNVTFEHEEDSTNE